MGKLVRLLIILFTIFISTSLMITTKASAEQLKSIPLILDETTVQENLFPSIDLIKDRNDEYIIHDMLKVDIAEQFTNIYNVKQKRGFFHSPNWLRFEIHNNSSKDDWLLEFAFPLVHELQLYTVEDGIVTELYDTGADFPFQQR